MDVDQKHVTTIRLHDAKGSDIRLCREGHDFQLRLASANNVVNISLGLQDVRKLWEQIIQLEIEEHWKLSEAAQEQRSILSGKPRNFHEAMASVFTRMAREMCEHAQQPR